MCYILPMAKLQQRKVDSRSRILSAASRAVRAQGFAGVSVAEVMREAGLTHGGFYAHFGSRDELIVAAMKHARQETRIKAFDRHETTDSPEGFRQFVTSYLSEPAMKNAAGGCLVAALGSEMPRQLGAIRRTSSASVKGMISYIATLLPAISQAEAAAIVGSMVGCLQIARTLSATDGSAMLEAARNSLIERYITE